MLVLSEMVALALNILHRLILIVTRYVFKNFIYGQKGQKVPQIKNPLLLESATSLATKIRTKKVTSVEVMQAFIDRIKEVNPIINCVVDQRYSEALKEAEDVDKFITSGVMTPEEMEKTKPFLGLPISTKDSICMKGLINSAGWFYRRNVRAEENAPAIEKMVQAGAIPFCITNVCELCMWYESSNIIYGTSKNPYDTFRIVGGSSGGEGGLQASAGSPFGVGSDIGGSIRMPAFFNGIFGHKPSRYVVSNELQYPPPHSDSEEHMLGIGPMSRFACDLKPMLKVMAKDDKLAALRLDDPVDVKKLKVYYQEDCCGGLFVEPVDEDIQLAFRKVVHYFKHELQVEVERVQISRTKETIPMWFASFKGEGTVPLAQELSPNPNEKINPYYELIKKCFGLSNHSLILLLLAINDEFSVKQGSVEQQKLLEERDKMIKEFREMLKDEMSIFLYPTHPVVAPYHNEAMVKGMNVKYTALINLLGMPSCNVPLGLSQEGLPVGIQVVANYNNDRLCLAVASELEKVFGGWVNPNPHKLY